MEIKPIAPKCFAVRELNRDVATFDRLVSTLRSRGVDVTILPDQGQEKRFCIA